MARVKKSDDIGMKRGRVLSNLRQPEQLDVIAEGLPLLMKSAGELLAASKALGEHHRAATILEGHAMEEVGKILILIDIVRCPPKLRQSRLGSMMKWFYDHLARLIYIDAQYWNPVNVKQLQEYVDSHRKSHSLEGAFDEYIVPNWTTWLRESTLYADIFATEDGELTWNEPDASAPMFEHYEALPWQVCLALRDVGTFTRAGLDIVSSVWSHTRFADSQDRRDSTKLAHEMLWTLQDASLIAEDAREEQLSILCHRWQLPMYCVDFERLEVPLAELQAERDAQMSAEVGY